jgi:hypothetical protein
MMTKIFTPLTLIATIIAVVLFDHLTGYSVESFSFFFIIPLGALLIGAAASSGLFFGLLKDNKPVSKKYYVIGAFVGLIAFFGVYYVSYQTTYISADNQVNYSFNGNPISNFTIGGEPVTFGKFISLAQGGKEQFFFHGRPIGDGFDAGNGFNSFMYYLEILAAVVAGAGVGLTIVGGKTYCDKCKKYMLEKTLAKISIEKFDEITNEINASLTDVSKLKQIFSTNEMQKGEKVKAYTQVDLVHCPNCYDARFVIKIFQLGSKSSFEEVSKYRQTLRISEETARGFANS